MENYQTFNGKKFRLDKNTGYYLNSTLHERIHRYIWSYYNGDIPEGYHVHHIDHNKSNNDISNLQLLLGHEHIALHTTEYHQINRESVLQHLETIRPLTKEWHSSKSGIDWHKQHYEYTKAKLHLRIDMVCKNCGSLFQGLPNHSIVCSNKCKSALRRKSGIDNIKVDCYVCGMEFIKNKYSKHLTCSQKCGHQVNKNTTDNQTRI
jgi:predicted nucleic acid-binding Zn ribbon protein